jgi:flagellar FliL protein
MADENKDATDDGGANKGGMSLVVVLLVALLCLGLGAGGAFLLLGSGGGGEAAAEAEVAEAEPANPAEGLAERSVALEPFVVNVTGDGYPRYLKLKIELEADAPAAREEIEARLAHIRDTIILLLSSKRLEDIGDFEGKALLKDDLRDRINGLLESGEVRSVLFTEFVVQ